MGRSAPTNIEHLFDRPWRPGQPFGRRAGRLRRWGMVVILLVLCGVISGYGYVTDSDRVRSMAESYLSGLTGGRITVGRATLSIFEGLRLDDVKMYVDPVAGPAPDNSLLFQAQTFVVRYHPRSMLTGRLEATQILAQKPEVHLTEDLDRAEWNYQHLSRPRRTVRTSGGGGKPIPLPELLLRNARVVIRQVKDGHPRTLGSMAIDGRLAPSDDGERYTFNLQSRGALDGLGPSANGAIAPSGRRVTARLLNLEFDRDVWSMIPIAEVREWWQAHGLSGAVDISELSYTPPRDGTPGGFRVVTDLRGVTMWVHPEEWMGRADLRRLDDRRRALGLMRDLYRAAGFRVARGPPTEGRGVGLRSDGSPPPLAAPRPPTTPSSPIDRLAALAEPPPVALQNVAGRLVFTPERIDVQSITGRVEGNGFKIAGQINGYDRDFTASLQLATLDGENLYVPPSPRYVASLPREARELYHEFQPQGDCRLWVRVERRDPAARPEISGRIDVVNGRFVFDRFPYPLRDVTGRLEFGRDEATGVERLIVHVRGRGLPDGPNRDTVLSIDSYGDHIGPLGTNECGVNVRIAAKGAHSEDALLQAFPPDVRQALKTFDAPGKGEFPKLHGDFVCNVVRPVGRNRHWTFDTDLTLTDAAGVLAAFPYPFRHVTGVVRIRDGYADVENLATRRGDASLRVNGRVGWGRGPESQTRLDLSVRNLPIDDDLLAALPGERRDWLKHVGLSGKLDIDGRIMDGPAGPPPSSAGVGSPRLQYDLSLALRDGAVWPGDGTFAVNGLAGKLRLTADRLEVHELRGRRGATELVGGGLLDWSRAAARPRLRFDLSAQALALDPPLYALLPAPARRAWDEVQPEGTLDADIHYDGPVGGPDGAERAPVETLAAADATGPIRLAADPAPSLAPPRPSPVASAVPHGFSATLKPRNLSVTLRSVPYRLDRVRGTVTVRPDRVRLEDVTARHRDSTIALAGTGTLGDRQSWDLRLAGRNLPVDADLRRALPPALAGLIDSLKLKGTIHFDLSRFAYRAEGSGFGVQGLEGERESTASLNPEPRTPNPEIDLTGTLTLADASLDVGVLMEQVNGQIDLGASLRDDRLARLRGDLRFDSMTLAGRPVRNFRTELEKPEDLSELRLKKIGGQIAGGSMGGFVTVGYPDHGPSRYSMSLVLREADVAALAWESGENGQNIDGKLTASLSLEGSWDDATKRRGRGDVMVVGRKMYRIPLVLGLLQVTNLALPISGPFNEGTARYSLDGQRVTFEHIELRSDTMMMRGDGSLDFGMKSVALTFNTDNPGGLKLPFLHELWQGARSEMLKIHVRGTIQEPKVSATSMGTVWTTVDEVFKGESPKKQQPKSKARRGKRR